jgi:hypothetical protein
MNLGMFGAGTTAISYTTRFFVCTLVFVFKNEMRLKNASF